MAPGLLSSQALVANCVGLAAGFVAVKMMMDQETSMAPPTNPCPTCNGMKRIPCMCSRWSDGDSGCSSCQGSGTMPCNSCGGTGKGRPLPSRVTVSRRNPGS